MELRQYARSRLRRRGPDAVRGFRCRSLAKGFRRLRDPIGHLQLHRARGNSRVVWQVQPRAAFEQRVH